MHDDVSPVTISSSKCHEWGDRQLKMCTHAGLAALCSVQVNWTGPLGGHDGLWGLRETDNEKLVAQ